MTEERPVKSQLTAQISASENHILLSQQGIKIGTAINSTEQVSAMKLLFAYRRVILFGLMALSSAASGRTSTSFEGI